MSLETGMASRARRFMGHHLFHRLCAVACLALVLGLALAVTSCSGPPKAVAVADKTSGAAPLDVSFSNKSENAETFKWDFGDGANATSTKKDAVSHEYTKAGAHTVTVTAIKPGNPEQTATTTLTINVDPGPLVDVVLDSNSATLVPEQTQAFKATARDQYGNPIPNASITFKAADGAGQVDAGGTLTAGTKVGSFEGGLTATASQGGVSKQAVARVTIQPGPLDHVKIDPINPAVEVTKQQTFTAAGLDKFDNPIPGLTYAFSAASQAGQVDGKGVFTAGKKAGSYDAGVSGEATQGATTKEASVKLLVQAGPLDHVTLDPATPSVEVTKQQTITATGRDQYDNAISTGVTFAYAASGPAVQVDSQGVLTAGQKAGSYDNALSVEATQGSTTKKLSVRVVVQPGPLDHVKLDPAAPSIAAAQQQTFTATALDQFENPISGLNVTYRASDQAGQVDSKGVFTAGKTAGSYDNAVTVEVTQGAVTKNASVKVTVQHGPLDSVKVTPDAVSLDIGKQQQFTAQALDAFGNAIPEATLTWSADEKAGMVTDKGMLTTGTKAGTFATTATASAGGVSKAGNAAVTVKPGPAAKLSVGAVEVQAGGSAQLKAFVADQYDNPLEQANVTWTVLNPNAGSIDSSGTLSAGQVAGVFDPAVEAGASTGGLAAQGAVTIVAGPLSQVVIGPNPATIGIGMTQKFVAVGADRYGNRITGLKYTWSVEAQGGAISADGLFTAGSSSGTFAKTVKATTTAADGSTFSATADVNVEADRIAYLSGKYSDGFDLYIMNADGTNQKMIMPQMLLGAPAWSPDGRRIISDPAGFILVMSDDGAWASAPISDTSMVGDLYHPSYSPDGSKIVYQSYQNGYSTSDAEIYVMDADGGNQTRLTNNNFYDSYPSFSPDGKKIVFTRDEEGDGSADVYVMNADGTNAQRLTNSGKNYSPRFSPDGTKILYDNIAPNSAEVIRIMNADGSNNIALTSGPFSSGDAAWSPDGKKIIFYSYRDSKVPSTTTDAQTIFSGSELYTMNPDGSGVQRLTNDTNVQFSPVWAPRKRGVTVTEESIVIPNASTLKPLTAQDITAKARASVVRIVRDDGGSGSGFIIDPNGLIMTCNHVVVDAKKLTVYLDNGKSYTATVVGRDMLHDLAVIKIDATGLPALAFGDVSQVAQASQVVVMGYPLGSSDLSVTSGIASAFKTDVGTGVQLVQTDSAINPGNSGGPMLDGQGRVIGVVSSKFVGNGIEGVGFAISVNSVDIWIDQLEAGQTIRS